MRTLLTRRWLAAFAAATAFFVVCLFLGRWQWGRHEDRSAYAAAVTRNYDAAPVPLDRAPHVSVIAMGPAPWRPADVVAALSRHGLRRILVEGGGRTVSSFLAADVLDVLYVTTVPIFLGDGIPGVRVPAVGMVADAPRHRARSFKLGDDLCIELTLRPRSRQDEQVGVADGHAERA